MTGDDILTRLDPTTADEPRFDPHGEVARGVLAAAIARGTQPTPGAVSSMPRRRSRLLAGVAATSLAAIAAVAVLAGGSSTLSPTDALAQAVDHTAAFQSGVIRYHTEGTGESGYRLDSTHEVRFSGADMEMIQRGEEVLPSGTHERHDITYRQVGGRQWVRNDDLAGQWRTLGIAPDDGASLADRTRAEVGNRALVELVKTASDVHQDGSTFRATLDGAAVHTLTTVPFDLDRVPATARIDIEISLAGDGTIERMGIRTPGSSRTVEYSDLGAPQAIAAPQR